jgi:two-component system, cell cycle sensor histidine kinase and response regulator CckA
MAKKPTYEELEQRVKELKQAESERKRAKRALTESEQELRLTISVTTDGIWKWNFLTNELFFSPKYYTMLGYEPDEFPASYESWINLIHPDDLETTLLVAENYLKTKPDTYENEFRLKTKSGYYRWFRSTAWVAERAENGEAVRTIGNHQDITEAKQAEEALRESEEKYRSMSKSMKDPVYMCSQDFRIEYMNPSMIRRTGYDATGEKCFKAVHELNEKCPWCMYDRIRQGEHYEVAIVSPKDNRSYHVSSSPVVHGDGTISKMTIFRDTTDFKKLETQLLQAQKMESVGRLAGGVAHDFNNNLAVIQGYTQILLEDMNPGDSHHESLAQILDAAKRSASLTHQLLAFARKQTISPKRLDLNDTVEGMLKMLRRLIGENIELLWRPGNLWNIKMDPAQVDQILANLCVNAKDAIDGIGKLTIETRNVDLDSSYCSKHAGFEPGQYAMLAVSDDGSGMDKATLQEIFEPFFTTKEVGKGTGLGLSTIYGIVKQNDAFINVYSEPGKGTTFKIYIPRYQGEHSDDTPDRSEEIRNGHGETILLVEDDVSVLNLSKTLLERLGYTVFPANGPDEAIAIAKEATQIHLLMTDVVMPQMGGNELAKKITEIQPRIQTIFMSGYTANAIAHQGILDEGVNFIEKPFTLNDLGRKIGDILKNARS